MVATASVAAIETCLCGVSPAELRIGKRLSMARCGTFFAMSVFAVKE
jgi:hypothetical protein